MKWAISSIMLVIVGGMCFAVFIIFNYAYNNPDSGLFPMILESANRTLSGTMASWLYSIRNHVVTGFGIAGVTMFGLAILIYVVDALMHPGSEF